MQLIVVTGKTYRPSKIKSYFDITDQNIFKFRDGNIHLFKLHVSVGL